MSKYNVGDKFIFEISEVRDIGLYGIKDTGEFIEEYILDILPKYDNFYDALAWEEAKQKAYEDGMNAAWDVARKIMNSCNEGGLSMKEICDIFHGTFVGSVFKRFSAKEAKDMIERYEAENKIQEGDVVEILDQQAVVLAIDKGIASVYVIDNDDGKVQELMLHQLKKVGHSIDVRKTLARACVKEAAEYIRKGREE